MKKAVAGYLFLLAGMCGGYAQQTGWTDLFPNMPDTPTDTIYIGGIPYYGTYTDLFFISELEGWVTSLQQNDNQEFLIFHTADGGDTWEIQKHWNYSQAIWMLDPLNGYLGDQAGFIMVTHDGGDTWSYHGATGQPVTDITFAPGSDTGYVTTDESTSFWQITPAGVNPIAINHLNYWTGISATDASVWFCGGIQVFRWDPAMLALTPELVNHCGYFGPVFFRDRDHGWIGNLCEIRGFVNYDYYWPEILSTEEDAIQCLHATDTNRLWAVTMDGTIYHTENASDYGYIKETNYYWSNVVWETQPHPKEGNSLIAVQFITPQTGYACGENNTILKYTTLNGIPESASAKIRLYPNPAQGCLQISLPAAPPGNYRLAILTPDGRTLSKKTLAVTAASRISSINIGNLPRGFYLVKITGEGISFCDKLLVE